MPSVEAPCFSKGELDFSPAEKRPDPKMGFSPGFPRALKPFYPRMNAGVTIKGSAPVFSAACSVVPKPLRYGVVSGHDFKTRLAAWEVLLTARSVYPYSAHGREIAG